MSESAKREEEQEGRYGAWREVLASVAALIGFYVLSALYLRPIWRTWQSHLAPNQGDPLFVLYLLKWVGHEVGRGFAGYWEAPFFYPAHEVLAYSDHMVGPGLVATAWNAVVPGWVGAYNMLYLSAFALTAWTLTWVLRRSGRSWPAALLGGALYAFNPFRWDQAPHLQVLVMAAIPLALWTFDRLLAAATWPRAAAFLLCYAVHLSGGCYLSVMIHIPLLVLAANRLLGSGRTRLGRRQLAILLTAGATAAAMFGSFFWEYWKVSKREGLAWSSETGRHWGASLLSYLQPSESNFYNELWPAQLWRPENSLFPGYVAVALCVAGLVLWVRTRRATPAPSPRPAAGPHGAWQLLPLALAVAGWVGGEWLTWSEQPGTPPPVGLGTGYGLAMASFLVGIGGWAALRRRRTGRWFWEAAFSGLEAWPRGVLLAGLVAALFGTAIFYVPLALTVPGFAAMRVPARFHAFTTLTIAFFGALAVDALAARLRAPQRPRWRSALFLVGVLLLASAELSPLALPWTEIESKEDDFPDVYGWLAEEPDMHALLELPLSDPTLDAVGPASIRAMYYGTIDWRPRVNGYSAHFTRAYWLLTSRCNPMPDARSMADLRRWGVTHILIHRLRLPLVQRQALAKWDTAHPGALVYAGDGDRVYRLSGPPTPADILQGGGTASGTGTRRRQ